MKKLNITFGTILLALGCFAFSQAVKADGEDETQGYAIVGLWQEHYTSNGGPQFDTYSQWHSDGLEIETPSFAPGACQVSTPLTAPT